MIPAGIVSRIVLSAIRVSVKKPPPALPKFDGWKCPISRTRTVTTGIAIFHLVM